MTPQELEKLGKAAREAYDAHEALEIERSKWVSDRVNAINAEACSIYGERLEKLRLAKLKTEQELQAASNNNRVEEAVTSLPFPEGTILVRDRSVSPSWGDHALYRMDKGVLEVFREGDEERGNMGYWHRRPVGQIVVRQIKKDGSKGKLYLSWVRTKHYWKSTGELYVGESGSSALIEET